MSDQTNEFNSDAPPRQAPEPSLREGGFVGSGNLVTMHQAQQGNGNESFPVLQAFQEYIDAERKQARKRVVQLSIGFAAILGVVVVGFLAAGVSMLQNMTSTNDRLVEVLAQRNTVHAPVQMQPAQAQSAQNTSPVLEESIREMSRVLAEMQEKDQTPPKTAVPVAESAPVTKAPVPDPAVAALKADLDAIKVRNQKMEKELVALKNKKAAVQRAEASSKVVQDALEIARKTGAEKNAADKAAADAAAAIAAKKIAEKEKVRLADVEAEKEMAVKFADERAKAEREAQARRKTDSSVAAVKKSAPPKSADLSTEKPVATKAPPVVAAGVKSPEPPKDMIAASIPLNMKDGDVVPWRIFVPK